MSFAGPRFSGHFWQTFCYAFLSFLPSAFGFIILFLPVSRDDSEQQLTQSGLQSLLLHWLTLKLNILFCTLLLNKDLHRSALCAFVSLPPHPLPVCLFKQEVLGLEPPISQTLGSPLFWRQRGVCCVLCWNQNFTPSIFSAKEEKGQGKKCHESTRGVGALIILAISSKVPLYCHPGEFTADNQFFAQQRPNFLLE